MKDINTNNYRPVALYEDHPSYSGATTSIKSGEPSVREKMAKLGAYIKKLSENLEAFNDTPRTKRAIEFAGKYLPLDAESINNLAAAIGSEKDKLIAFKQGEELKGLVQAIVPIPVTIVPSPPAPVVESKPARPRSVRKRGRPAATVQPPLQPTEAAAEPVKEAVREKAPERTSPPSAQVEEAFLDIYNFAQDRVHAGFCNIPGAPQCSAALRTLKDSESDSNAARFIVETLSRIFKQEADNLQASTQTDLLRSLIAQYDAAVNNKGVGAIQRAG